MGIDFDDVFFFLPLRVVLPFIVFALVLLAIRVLRPTQRRRPTAVETFAGYPEWTEWCADTDGDFVQNFTRIAMKRLDNMHLCSMLIVSVRAWNRGVEGIIFVNKHSATCQMLRFIQPGKVGDIAVLVIDFASSPNIQLATAFFEGGGGAVEEVSLESNVFDDLRAHITKRSKNSLRPDMRSGLTIHDAIVSPIVGEQ
jgi:hypothetical protein